jgi:hypothetical protein
VGDLVGQERPDRSDNCQDRTDGYQSPGQETLAKSNLVSKKLQVEETGQDDADREAERRAHERHDAIERRTDDRQEHDQQRDDNSYANLQHTTPKTGHACETGRVRNLLGTEPTEVVDRAVYRTYTTHSQLELQAKFACLLTSMAA